MKYLSEVYGRGGIYAKCVAASIANGIPIYTLETKAPKFIDAEFEKHRMLSSNSSSSRAIPFGKSDMSYVPFDVRYQEKGMQGFTNLNYEDYMDFTTDVQKWRDIFLSLVSYYHNEIKVHKQHLNRYLEPWMFQKKVVTATEWDNFFRLRLAPDAQPEMQELAKCMKSAIDQVEPTVITGGLQGIKWHLPYINRAEFEVNNFGEVFNLDTAIKCSAARCARVSYNNHDNSSPSVEKDLALAELLLSSGHLTPFEHQATPMVYEANYNLYHGETEDVTEWEEGLTHMDRDGNYWSGNFRGFLQYRQMISTWNS